MNSHGDIEKARWKEELNDIKQKFSSWIESIRNAEHNDCDAQIENLVDTLLTWQQLAIQVFDAMEIAMNYVDKSEMTEFEWKNYAHTYSNAVHAFTSAGVDNHTHHGVKTHLVEIFD